MTPEQKRELWARQRAARAARKQNVNIVEGGPKDHEGGPKRAPPPKRATRDSFPVSPIGDFHDAPLGDFDDDC